VCVLTSDKENILKNINIVLVSPQIPENIGLCARILKNTSFNNFCLVRPNLTHKSFEVAKRARDILEKAKLAEDLKSVLKESYFVFGTTKRRRKYKFIYNFKDILPFIAAVAKKYPISIIFGQENFGLSKEEIDCCDSLFYIPANPSFSSYNLASSVGIVCYKIFEYLIDMLYVDFLDLVKKEDIESLFVLIDSVLKKTDLKNKIAKTTISSLKRIFLRTHLTKNEVQLLKTIFLSISKQLK